MCCINKCEALIENIIFAAHKLIETIMKTTRLKLLGAAILCFALNTSSYGQTNLNSKIEPFTSNGYAMWNSYASADSYQVTYYTLENGTYSQIGKVNTENLYTKLHIPYFTQGGVYFSISALEQNRTIIATGDIQPLGDWPPGEELCAQKCNGSSYAYEINMWENHLGQRTLQLNNTYDYAYTDNESELIAVPFYQALSTGQIQALENTNHPYENSGSQPGTYLYPRIPITPSLIETAGPFFNSQNITVENGVIIPKKMDQFKYMEVYRTSISAYPSENLCTYPLTGGGGWIDFYNQHNTIPTNQTFYWGNTVSPSALTCSSTGIGSDPEPGQNWNDWFLEVKELAEGLEDGGNGDGTITQDDILNSFDMAQFKSINITSLDDPNSTKGSMLITYDTKNNISTVLSQTGQFTKGLYKLIAVSETGKILPYVFELTHDTKIVSFNQYAKLLIAPNPVVGNQLNLIMSTTRNINAILTVYKLDGEMVYSGNVQLSRGLDLHKTVDVGREMPPYGQFIVTLSFPDASSIQETALKIN